MINSSLKQETPNCLFLAMQGRENELHKAEVYVHYMMVNYNFNIMFTPDQMFMNDLHFQKHKSTMLFRNCIGDERNYFIQK